MTAPATPRVPVVRRPDQDYDHLPRRHYLRGSPMLTGVWDVFTVMATPVEAFFIRDGAKAKHRIDDPALLARVEAFVKQEANHSAEHQRANRVLEQLGFPVQEAQARMRASLDRLAGDDKEQLRLAVVCAGEHFLGELGYLALEDPATLDGMDEPMRTLVAWHGYEEFEHQSVAIDTYHHLFGTGWASYRMRLRGLVAFFRTFGPPIRRTVVEQRRQARHGLGSPAAVVLDRLRFLDYMLRRPGLGLRMARNFLPYLRPGFHPSRLRDAEPYLERFASVIDPDWVVAGRTQGF